ncbi:hypothetical protein ACFYZJ_28755 [Streptomyces sp. NPDC001848]|uniref:hypothetical protein n=1 Tax=Streptomyces sp. NPDC001848 TaxID=3364618 RepID=UPI0036CFF541
MVEFDITKVVQIDHASSLRWAFHACSPVNPPARAGGRPRGPLPAGGTSCVAD